MKSPGSHGRRPGQVMSAGEPLGPPERSEGEPLRRQRLGWGLESNVWLCAAVSDGMLCEFIQGQPPEASRQGDGKEGSHQASSCQEETQNQK